MIAQRPQASEKALALITNLPWTLYGHKAPVRSADARDLAKFVDQMLDDGYTETEIRLHLASTLRSCDGRNPVLYLENAMIGDLLPARKSVVVVDYDEAM